MRRLQIVALLSVWIGIALASPTPAAAQTGGATTGAINGKVTDATNAVMPGVTVTIASPSMQGVRTAVTNEEGIYRFPSIPPGDYKITYELGGFSTVIRDGVRVGLGFTATINVELKVASLAESVTVSGQSPVVDVATTKTSTNFDAQMLAALPNARDFWAILAAAPAIQMQRIDVGGSAAGTQTGYSTYDTKSDQHRPMVEGIVNTEGTNAAGFYYDYGSMEEVSVTTGANTPEMPWAGVMTQFIAKSGGNTYHGRVYADYENENIQSRNIDQAQQNLGVVGGGGLSATDLNRMHSYRDLNGDVGGYIKHDKLWWYSSLRDQKVQSLAPNFPVKPFETHLQNITGKGTYALNSNNKIVGFAQWGNKEQPNRLDTFLIGATAAIHNSADSTWNQAYWAHTYKLGWDSVRSDKMFFEVHGGQFHYLWPNTRYTQAPAYQDLATNIVRGGNQDGWFRDITRNQILGSLSYFKDGWAGSHNFKVGGEFFNERYDDLRGQDGLGQVPNDVLMITRNASPTEVILFQTPSASLNGLQTTGLYVSDSWRAASRVTFTLGLVYDRYRSYLPAQTGPPVGPFNPTQVSFAAVDNLITWNLAAPRLGLTYDLSGNGKTVLKANYAFYWWNPGTTSIDSAVNPNAPDWYRRYNWTDTAVAGCATCIPGDKVWQNGEQGALPTSSFGGVGSTQLDPEPEGPADAGVRDVPRTRGGSERRRSRGLRVPPDRSVVPERQPESSDQCLQCSDQRPDPEPQWHHHCGRADAAGLQPQSCEPGAAGRQFLAQHAGQGRLLQPRAGREPSHEPWLVAERVVLVSLEPRQLERVLRPEPSQQTGCCEPERHDQQRQRPVRLWPVDRQGQRVVRCEVGAPYHTGLPSAAGAAGTPVRSRRP